MKDPFLKLKYRFDLLVYDNELFRSKLGKLLNYFLIINGHGISDTFFDFIPKNEDKINALKSMRLQLHKKSTGNLR